MDKNSLPKSAERKLNARLKRLKARREKKTLSEAMAHHGYRIEEVKINRYRVTNPSGNIFGVLWDYATVYNRLLDLDFNERVRLSVKQIVKQQRRAK